MNETTQERGLGLATVQRRGEMAVSAMAAKSKAEVEAKFVIALNRPRNLMGARASILDACKRPRFAESARYMKPVGGGKTIDGLSIRFAETAIQAMTNIAVETATIWEDEEKRTVHISVTDLESNLSYGKDVTIDKRVERRQLKPGQMAISERVNSTGQRVFLVAATEDEVANKVASSESKIIRNCGLRLIPQDILEEAEEAILQTLEKGGGDPAAETKRVADAFTTLNIRPNELERYLGHGLATVSKKELGDLRAIYAAIRDGEASWSDYIKGDQAKPIFTETPAAASSMGDKSSVKSALNPMKAVRGLMKLGRVEEAALMSFLRESGNVDASLGSLEELEKVSPTKLLWVYDNWGAIEKGVKAAAVGQAAA